MASSSSSSSSCVGDTARTLACRDGRAAAHLKVVSIFVIFITSVVGISLPVLLARLFQGRSMYDKVVLIIKCFAAGVILSTSLVHVLPEAFAALSDCHVASHHPWKDFPFSGLVTLIGALLALLVDLTASSHVDAHKLITTETTPYTPIGTQDGVPTTDTKKSSSTEFRVETAALSVSCHGNNESGGEMVLKLKQRLVSQVLEIGIIFHSIIIGVTMGMSQNQCTIRPLIAALSFHQIFEGLGLGGCIAQVNLNPTYLHQQENSNVTKVTVTHDDFADFCGHPLLNLIV